MCSLAQAPFFCGLWKLVSKNRRIGRKEVNGEREGKRAGEETVWWECLVSFDILKLDSSTLVLSTGWLITKWIVPMGWTVRYLRTWSHTPCTRVRKPEVAKCLPLPPCNSYTCPFNPIPPPPFSGLSFLRKKTANCIRQQHLILFCCHFPLNTFLYFNFKPRNPLLFASSYT